MSTTNLNKNPDIDKISKLLKDTLFILKKYKEEDKPLKKRDEKVNYIIQIIELMDKEGGCWEKCCRYHYKYYEDELDAKLSNFIKNKDIIYKPEEFDALFLLFIRFLLEAMMDWKEWDDTTKRHFEDLYGDSIVSQGRDCEEIWKWFESLSENDIAKEMVNQFHFIKTELRWNILHYYSTQNITIFDDLKRTKEEFKKEKEEFKKENYDLLDNISKLEKIKQEVNQEFNYKAQEVQRLETSLKTYKEGFNFVGLSSGFSNLLSKKEKNNKISFTLLCVIGGVIIFLPLINIGIYIFSDAKFTDISWQQLLIGIGLEFVLIYFFRVILNQYRAVETQIMQLELRLSLCQFIQAYAEYAKEIKANDKDALEKFENLIFSSILSNDNNIPSTFDGMEQVTQLIKELKSKP